MEMYQAIVGLVSTSQVRQIEVRITLVNLLIDLYFQFDH